MPAYNGRGLCPRPPARLARRARPTGGDRDGEGECRRFRVGRNDAGTVFLCLCVEICRDRGVGRFPLGVDLLVETAFYGLLPDLLGRKRKE